MRLTQIARLLGKNAGQPVPEEVLEALIVSGILDDLVEAGPQRITIDVRGKLRQAIGLEKEHPARFTVRFAKPLKTLHQGWAIESHEQRTGSAALTIHLPPPPPIEAKKRANPNISLTDYLAHIASSGYDPLGQHAAEEVLAGFPSAWEGTSILFPATFYKNGTSVAVPVIATTSEKGRKSTPHLSLMTVNNNPLSRSTTRIACIKRA